MRVEIEYPSREIISRPKKEISGLTTEVAEQIDNFLAAEVKPGPDGKYIMPLNGLGVNLSWEAMRFSKQGGLFVVDKNAMLYETKNGIEREKSKLTVPSETHEDKADLWIYDGRTPVNFIVGGRLTSPYFKSASGNYDRRELLGDSIEGGKKFVLSEEQPFLLIPPRIPHAHGGDGIVSAYIMKLSFPEAVKVSRFSDLVQVAGVNR